MSGQVLTLVVIPSHFGPSAVEGCTEDLGEQGFRRVVHREILFNGIIRDLLPDQSVDGFALVFTGKKLIAPTKLRPEFYVSPNPDDAKYRINQLFNPEELEHPQAS